MYIPGTGTGTLERRSHVVVESTARRAARAESVWRQSEMKNRGTLYDNEMVMRG